jgi:hypothetical protein
MIIRFICTKVVITKVGRTKVVITNVGRTKLVGLNFVGLKFARHVIGLTRLNYIRR